MTAERDPFVPWVVRPGRPSGFGRCAVSRRKCRHHGWGEFALYSRGKGKRQWRCKRCIAERVTRRHQKVKRILVEEAGSACAVCGYHRCIINMHFHHVDPAQKSFAVSTATGKALDTYRQELLKCVLVCANCHGEIEAGLIPSPPPGTKWRAAAS